MHFNKKHLLESQFSGSSCCHISQSLCHIFGLIKKKPFSFFILSSLFLCSLSNLAKRGQLRSKVTSWIIV